ncbi:hypothetical protein D3C84_730750 [compost metagenome]
MRMKLFDGHRQHQRAGPAQDLQAVWLLRRHNADPGIGPDHEFAIHQHAVDASCHRCTGQPQANTRGDFMNGQGLVVLTQ